MKIKLASGDIELLARFFVSEWENDAIGVGEWLDDEGAFDTQGDRDAFIDDILTAAREGVKP